MKLGCLHPVAKTPPDSAGLVIGPIGAEAPIFRGLKLADKGVVPVQALQALVKIVR